MNRYLLCILCGLALSVSLFAGDIERVHATYEYISDDPNETPAQAEAKAFERARLKALEEAFGLDVSAVTSSFVSNSAGSNVLSLGGTSVRGEWIETTKEQIIDKRFEKGFWHVKVRVEGRARSNSTEKSDIHYVFVRDVRDVEAPVSFRDGNDLFMRFSSPVAGSLCVYQVDEEQTAFCLLPYLYQQTGAQAVEANKEYIFFSDQYDPQADEYTVGCKRSSEQNALYVIFSPNAFTKAHDRQLDTALPRQLSYEAFLKWLAKNQTKDPQMVVRREIISIRK